MLSVVTKPFMHSVVMLNVITLRVIVLSDVTVRRCNVDGQVVALNLVGCHLRRVGINKGSNVA
jgi:hypothetical protein